MDAQSGGTAVEAPTCHLQHISGLWMGEAICTSDSTVPTNPIRWSLSAVPHQPPPAPTLWGSGFFDDSGDVPGEPCLFYVLKGSFTPDAGDGSVGAVEFSKQYVSMQVPAGLTVQYRGRLARHEDGTTVMSGTWTNPLEST